MNSFRDLASAEAENNRRASAEKAAQEEAARRQKEEKLARSLTRVAEFLDFMREEGVPTLVLRTDEPIESGWVIAYPSIDKIPIDAPSDITYDKKNAGIFMGESGVSHKCYFEINTDTGVAQVTDSSYAGRVDPAYYGGDWGHGFLIRRAAKVYEG